MCVITIRRMDGWAVGDGAFMAAVVEIRVWAGLSGEGRWWCWFRDSPEGG